MKKKVEEGLKAEIKKLLAQVERLKGLVTSLTIELSVCKMDDAAFKRWKEAKEIELQILRLQKAAEEARKNPKYARRKDYYDDWHRDKNIWTQTYYAKHLTKKKERYIDL